MGYGKPTAKFIPPLLPTNPPSSRDMHKLQPPLGTRILPPIKHLLPLPYLPNRNPQPDTIPLPPAKPLAHDPPDLADEPALPPFLLLHPRSSSRSRGRSDGEDDDDGAQRRKDLAGLGGEERRRPFLLLLLLLLSVRAVADADADEVEPNGHRGAVVRRRQVELVRRPGQGGVRGGRGGGGPRQVWGEGEKLVLIPARGLVLRPAGRKERWRRLLRCEVGEEVFAIHTSYDVA